MRPIAAAVCLALLVLLAACSSSSSSAPLPVYQAQGAETHVEADSLQADYLYCAVYQRCAPAAFAKDFGTPTQAACVQDLYGTGRGIHVCPQSTGCLGALSALTCATFTPSYPSACLDDSCLEH